MAASLFSVRSEAPDHRRFAANAKRGWRFDAPLPDQLSGLHADRLQVQMGEHRVFRAAELQVGEERSPTMRIQLLLLGDSSTILTTALLKMLPGTPIALNDAHRAGAWPRSTPTSQMSRTAREKEGIDAADVDALLAAA